MAFQGRSLKLFMSALALLGLALTTTMPAIGEDCIPPVFYTSLPRDREWFYGTAKDPDTDKARAHAIRNLGRQVTGDIEGWENADVEQLAGPGHDRSEVAQHAGNLLPRSSLLAGWEQDDFSRCKGYSYVLVRIEKEDVRKYLKENKKFREDLASSLTQRVEKVEKDVSVLQATSAQQDVRMNQIVARLNALEKRSSELTPTDPVDISAHDELGTKIRFIHTSIDQGRSSQEVERSLAQAEGDLGRLLKRLSRYDAKHKQAESQSEAAKRKDEDQKIAPILHRIWAGPVNRMDFVQIAQYYQAAKKYSTLHAFCHRLSKHIAAKGVVQSPDEVSSPKGGLNGTESLVALFTVHAAYDMGHDDQMRHFGVLNCDYCSPDVEQDDAEVLRDGEAFLKKYPNSPTYDQVRGMVQGVINRNKARDFQRQNGTYSSPGWKQQQQQ